MDVVVVMAADRERIDDVTVVQLPHASNHRQLNMAEGHSVDLRATPVR
jgi:hypothetical protein